FEATRRAYMRGLAATLRIRPAVYAVWIALSLLVVPMYMLAPQELAPTEDQGAIMGQIEAPPNASLELVSLYTAQVQRIFASFPEFSHSFQLTQPTGGFGGMLLVPWERRARSVFPIEYE